MRRRFADLPESTIPVLRGGVEGSDQEGSARQAEFLTLYTRSYRSIYALLLAFVGEPAAADDLMQQTSLLLWTKFDQFNGDGDDSDDAFGRWARTIARNVARNYRRWQHGQHLHFDDDLLGKIAWTRAAADELLELRKGALRSCLQKLTPSEASLLQACYGGGSDPAKSAAESGRSRDAIYKALRRIRLRLFRCVNLRLHLEGLQ